MKRIYTTAVKRCERKSTFDVKNNEQYKATALHGRGQPSWKYFHHADTHISRASFDLTLTLAVEVHCDLKRVRANL